jgi:DNA polymerase V
VLERTIRELNGIACIPWEDAPQPKKKIMCSRSFGAPVKALFDLEEAVAQFATRATEKFWKGGQYAGALMVFFRTNAFRTELPQYSNSASVGLITPTQDSRVIVQQVLSLLRPMYRPGYGYAKVGVMLSDLVNEAAVQEDLFASPSPGQDDQAARLMSVMDEINRRSRTKICSARQEGPAAYAMRKEHFSPAYTTDWRQLPKVT